MIEIRPCTPEDADALWDILHPIFSAGETYAMPRDINREDALAFWVEPPNVAFVAEIDGAVVGSYFIRPNKKGGGSHVCNCGYATGEAARGNGVARAMRTHSLDHARATGYAAMQFNFVVATNTRAIAIWEAHGFDTVGRLPDAFRHPTEGEVDALVMFRRL